jgi:hypothetical protein
MHLQRIRCLSCSWQVQSVRHPSPGLEQTILVKVQRCSACCKTSLGNPSIPVHCAVSGGAQGALPKKELGGTKKWLGGHKKMAGMHPSHSAFSIQNKHQFKELTPHTRKLLVY